MVNIFRALRELWYLKSHTMQPLSLIKPITVQGADSASPETSIRWISSVQISGISKHSLPVHSPSRVSFHFKVPNRGAFRTFIALMPAKSDRSCGSIEFAVEISTSENCSFVVYRQTINSTHDFSDRRWREVSVPLHRFAQQEIDLTLSATATSSGSADQVGALWGEPTLLFRKPLFEMWADVRSFIALHGLAGFVVESIKLLLEPVVGDRVQADELSVKHESPMRLEVRGEIATIKAETCYADSCQGRKFAVYINSRGNYFFGEIGKLLAAGLKETGCSVDLRSEKDGIANDVDWHIVVAPHEYFYIDHRIKLQPRRLPSNLILLNTEQISTQWFAKAYRFFSKAHTIWDLNHTTAEFMRSRGFPCFYLPLGYVADFDLFGEVKELPRQDEKCILTPEISRRSFLHDSLFERPIDILFIGYQSPRRAKFFAQASSVLSKYRCYFHFSDATTPVKPGINTFIDTSTAIGLAQRSKIVLNIHHSDEPYFEWHRVVMHGIWQRSLVLSESVDSAPPFEAGRDFVAVPLEEIASQLEFCLSSPEGRSQSQAIADCGFRTLTEECRLADVLRNRVAELYCSMSV